MYRILLLALATAYLSCGRSHSGEVAEPTTTGLTRAAVAAYHPDTRPGQPLARTLADAEGSPVRPPGDRAGAALWASLGRLGDTVTAALAAQRDRLARKRPDRRVRLAGRELTVADQIAVIDELLAGSHAYGSLAAAAVAPAAEVFFTGYYSPEVAARRTRTPTFRYPLLRYPDDHVGRLPARRAIERDDALGADTLALAWVAHPLDAYTLQLQGSGFVHYPSGEREYLAYDGTNRRPYRSIEVRLAELDTALTDVSLRGLRDWVDAAPDVRDTLTVFNPNYGFFRRSSGRARGAAGLDLTAFVSVAADLDQYPLGTVLLARVPVSGHPGEFGTRLLIVQDAGGAVRGSGHLDLYTGVGEAALDLAEVTGAGGAVYALLPREAI